MFLRLKIQNSLKSIQTHIFSEHSAFFSFFFLSSCGQGVNPPPPVYRHFRNYKVIFKPSLWLFLNHKILSNVFPSVPTESWVQFFSITLIVKTKNIKQNKYFLRIPTKGLTNPLFHINKKVLYYYLFTTFLFIYYAIKFVYRTADLCSKEVAYLYISCSVHNFE